MKQSSHANGKDKKKKKEKINDDRKKKKHARLRSVAASVLSRVELFVSSRNLRETAKFQLFFSSLVFLQNEAAAGTDSHSKTRNTRKQKR